LGEKSNAYRILVGKPGGKRPVGRLRHSWVDNIKIDLRETERGCMGWIDVAQDRDQWRALVNTVINLWVPQYAGKFLSSCTTDGFSRRA
jgi:transposase